MQTVHIESSCVYPSTIDCMAVGSKWASCRCYSLDFRTEEAGGLVGAIIGDTEDLIVGSLIITLGSELSLFLFLPLLVVNDRSAVAGTIIYMPLISYAARVQDDGEGMEHFPSLNIVVCPPRSNWLIDRRESRTVGVWRASTWEPGMTLTKPYWVAVTELSSPSSIAIGSESFSNVHKLQQSLHMWCDAPESMTHFGAAAASRGQAVTLKGLQSPVIARAAVAVVIFTFHYSFKRL